MKRQATLLARLLVAVILMVPSAHAALWECGERSNLPIEGKNYCAAGEFRKTKNQLENLFTTMLKRHESLYGNASAMRIA